jgi:transcriptional regulator of arginine metabolism
MHIIIQINVLNIMNLQEYRKQAIRELLHDGFATSQKYLVEELKKKGHVATQSSVSRDLKDIGAFKTIDGYTLGIEQQKDSSPIQSITDLIVDLHIAGPNLLVIKTRIGAAQQVALFLDECDYPGIVGNIGGDDTVFTATSNKINQRSLIDSIKFLIKRS